MAEDIMVPVAFFATIIAGIWLISYYNFQKRRTAHETLRHAITNGQPVSNELIERMSQIVDPARADLRRGVLFIAFGIAILVLGSIVTAHEETSLMPALGVAAFPMILGAAYLGLWRFGGSENMS